MPVLLNLAARIPWKGSLPFIVLISLIFLLRLPSFFEPHWFFDEGVYALFGRSIAQGEIPYQYIWDHKPLGIYLIYSLAYFIPFFDILVGAKILAFLSASVSAIFVFLIARQGFSKKVSLLAAFLFGIFSSLPFFDGNQANGEIFLIAPTLIAIYLIEPFSQNINTKKLFFAGLFVGVAMSIKQVAVVDLAFLTLILFLKEGKLIKNLVFLLVGSAIIPALITLITFFLGTSFPDFWFSVVEFNFSYVTNRKLGIAFNFLKILLLLIILFSFFRRNKIAYFPLFLWLGASSVGVLTGGQPFPHYLIQIMPVSGIILAVGFFKAYSTRLLNVTSVALAVFFAFVIFNSLLRILPYGDVFREWDYYPSFLKSAISLDATPFNSVFSERWGVNRNKKVVSYLNRNLSEDDSVYIWGGGTTTWLYYDLGTRLPSRYISFLHVEAIEKAEEETIKSLSDDPPTFIITTPHQTLPEITAFVKENYLKDKEIEDVTIYKAKKLRGD